MKVIYLHHSGFIVELEKSTFIFDAITNIQPHFLRKGRKNYFLATHSHTDHFAQRIFSYGTDYNSTYILSDDIPKRGGSNVHYMAPYQTLTFGDVTIQTFGSTDLGVSYLVSAEGKLIFHAGDLNWWDWDPKQRPDLDLAAEEADYKAELEKLKTTLGGKTLDLAFVPVDGRLGNSACKAAVTFIDELHPTLLAPMHFWDAYDLVGTLSGKAFGKGTRVLDISKRNEIIFDE
jgi:L-ascorbate metabolism protein UlaG (beta-lactamase superfamily)